MKATSGRDMKGHFFPVKLQEGTADLTYPYVHSIYTLLLIKHIFGKKICLEGQRLKVGRSFGLESPLVMVTVQGSFSAVTNVVTTVSDR